MNERCRVCGERTVAGAPAAGQPVACARCTAAYHRECFAYLGRCSARGCGSDRAEPIGDASLPAPLAAPEPAPPAPVEADRSPLVVPPPALPGDPSVLDLETPAEDLATFVMMIGILMAVVPWVLALGGRAPIQVNTAL